MHNSRHHLAGQSPNWYKWLLLHLVTSNLRRLFQFLSTKYRGFLTIQNKIKCDTRYDLEALVIVEILFHLEYSKSILTNVAPAVSKAVCSADDVGVTRVAPSAAHLDFALG